MPYIPKEHLKYNLLSNAGKGNWEVFEYPSSEFDELQKLTNEKLNYPYSYNSYNEYYDEINSLIVKYPNCKEKLTEYKNIMSEMNNKENWGIVKYTGKSNFSFINGRFYYCPIYKNKCLGIIDEEELTSYVAFDLTYEDIGENFNEAFEIEIDHNNAVKSFLENYRPFCFKQSDK